MPVMTWLDSTDRWVSPRTGRANHEDPPREARTAPDKNAVSGPSELQNGWEVSVIVFDVVPYRRRRPSGWAPWRGGVSRGVIGAARWLSRASPDRVRLVGGAG